MKVSFAHGLGDRVVVRTRGDARGRVRGLYVGEDGRRQLSVAYVDAGGDAAGPEWFGEEELLGVQ